MIRRIIEQQILQSIESQKVSLLFGPRRVGKTELLKSIYQKVKERAIWLNGEDQLTLNLLEERSISNYSRILEGNQYLFIDEAQYIPDISLKVKVMIDSISPLHILLSGSSAFHLAQNSYPLVGRSKIFQLYPFSHSEWKEEQDNIELQQKLEDKIIYGNYPELSKLALMKEKEIYLRDLVQTYLLKDILSIENIRNSSKLQQILILLAHQIGSEVSYSEIGRQLGINKQTVERYIDLLEKIFIIFKLSSFSNNLRKELSKSKKIYFFDNGIRNAIIGDFSAVASRKDIGQLWEQYFISERIKLHSYSQEFINKFFWKTYDGQEIDYIENYGTNIFAYECKWNENYCKIPVSFKKAYPDVKMHVINRRNYFGFLE